MEYCVVDKRTAPYKQVNHYFLKLVVFPSKQTIAGANYYCVGMV